MKFIPYGRQHINADDIDRVKEVLTSDFLTTGSIVGDFEDALCERFGANEAIVVSSGTAALHLAATVLLKPGDKVLTTPNSFVATANSILYGQGIPLFVDIDEYGNLDLDKCEEILRKDENIKAIFGVNFSGLPLSRKRLIDLRAKYGVKILEDACHSPGAKNVGDGKSCDLSVLSFHPVKHITTGEGGVILTNDRQLAKKIRNLRSGGITHNVDEFNSSWSRDSSGNAHPWAYEMHSLGYNYRLTDFQCALGISQLSRLSDFIESRRKIAKRYAEAFSKANNLRPLYEYTEDSVYHLYVLLTDFSNLKISRTKLFRLMRDMGIGLQLHYIPIPYHPYYKRLGLDSLPLPNTEKYFTDAFSIPIFPSMTEEDQDRVISGLMQLVG